MSPYLLMHMTEEQRLKDAYPKMLRNGLLLALAIHVIAFLVTPELTIKPYQLREKQVAEALAIPDQFEIPPPPVEEVKEQIVTEIAPFESFYPAETDHQNYYNSNPEGRYCTAVIDPKLGKFRDVFENLLKPEVIPGVDPVTNLQ